MQFRHVAIHYGLPNQDAFRPQASEEMEKKWNGAIAKSNQKQIDYPEELYDKNALLREALLSLKYARFYNAICEGHQTGDLITFSENGRVAKLRHEFGAEERAAGIDMGDQKNWCIPLAAMIDSARYRTNMAMDSFDRTSSLCRLNYPEIFGNPCLAGLKHLRNQLAHFHDRVADKKKTEIETVFAGLSCMDALRPAFKNVLIGNGRGEAKDIEALSTKYMRLIMGDAQYDSAKVTMMDDFANWMVKNFNGKARMQEAAIYAAGQIIQGRIGQAEQVLGYIRKHKTQLLDPEILTNDLADKGHVVTIGVKEFVRSMEVALSVDKQKSRVLGIERINRPPFSLAAIKAAFSRRKDQRDLS